MWVGRICCNIQKHVERKFIKEVPKMHTIPKPEDIPFFPIPETDELRKLWLITIVIGLGLTIVGLILRPYLKKRNHPTKTSTILIVVGVIVVICQGAQLLTSYL